MPELPDVVVYIEHLERRLAGRTLERVRLLNPFVLRSVTPPIASAEGKRVLGVRRIGKRIVFELEGKLFLVLHLMIAGRLRWLQKDAKVPGRITLAAFEFPSGTLVFTEPGKPADTVKFDVGSAGLHGDLTERMIRKLRAGQMPPPGSTSRVFAMSRGATSLETAKST